MKDKKRLISTLILTISLILVVVIIGGAVYLDSTDGWSKIGIKIDSAVEDVEVAPEGDVPEEQTGQEVVFVPYQSPDELYQLQIPDFWTGEERAGAAIFYSYDPAQGQPEQRAKIEIGRVANPDMMNSVDWLTEQGVDINTAQQAIFGEIPGAMVLQDNTESNPGDIKSVIYMPVNDEVLVVTAESFGGTRDVAIQFFNAILNSWQWVGEVVSPDVLAAEVLEVEAETAELDGGEEEAALEGEEMTDGELEDLGGTSEDQGEEDIPLGEE